MNRDPWADFWHRPENHRWSAVDDDVLMRVAGVMGWGPNRKLIELGGGRGEHTARLYRMGRCDFDHMVSDPSADARTLARRNGCRTIDPYTTTTTRADVVWSFGLCEHFDGYERERIVLHHFALSTDLVVIVVPAKTWTRRLSPPRAEVPWQREFTPGELLCIMTLAAVMDGRSWKVEKPVPFAPLFGLRHIPDAVYEVATPIASKVLPGNLLMGVARRV